MNNDFILEISEEENIKNNQKIDNKNDIEEDYASFSSFTKSVYRMVYWISKFIQNKIWTEENSEESKALKKYIFDFNEEISNLKDVFVKK